MSDRTVRLPMMIGTETPWGRIGAVGLTGGERYYWMVDRHGCVSMIPAFMVEPSLEGREGKS